MATLGLLLLFIASLHCKCFVSSGQCYADEVVNLGPTVLGSFNFNPFASLTNELCSQVCYNFGYKLGGTENGRDCHCANAVANGSKIVDASYCNTPCWQNSHEKCGGQGYLSVFAVHCSGAPEPPPPSSPFLNNPCLNQSAPYHKMPFCDATLALAARVKDILARLTQNEKIALLGTGGTQLKSIGTYDYNFWSEATHGVATYQWTYSAPTTTNFAFPITTAMSFNRLLWRRTGHHIAREARALMNQGQAWSTFWAPVINLAREPRWGRNLETPGEDPYLTGEYATSFVRGFQEAPEDPRYLLASACCKHFVANSMDSTTQQGVNHNREEFDATVPIQDLMDSYMPPFQACVEIGKVSGLMCSYNAVNGVPSCANSWLLKEVARGDWAFDGYITSDCDADSDVYYRHHYTKTPEEAVRKIFDAGTDVDCGDFVSQFVASAIEKGVVSWAMVDARLAELFKVRMRLGHFDPISPLNSIPLSEVCSSYGQSLAREGTVASAALLKNQNQLLPLTASPGLKVAVIGPNAKLSQAMAGYYASSWPCGAVFPTVFDAVSQYANASYFAGVANVSTNDTSLIPAAVSGAKAADFVVLVLGTDLSMAREGMDATSIAFSDGQAALWKAVAQASRRPVIIVTLTAVPLDLTDALQSLKVGAILHAGQPSVQTLGIGDLLFGVRVPSGRTIQTILPSSYAGQISVWDFNMRPGPSVYPRPDCNLTTPANCPRGTNPGRTYRFYTGQAVVPFGYGLSYSKFQYALHRTPLASHSPSAKNKKAQPLSILPVKRALASFYAAKKKSAAKSQGPSFPSIESLAQPLAGAYVVNVTNVGNYDAEDAVLGFVVPPGAGQNGVPLKVLFGFEKVFVPKGKTVQVFIYPGLREFTQTNEKGILEAKAGAYRFQFGLPETAVHGQGYATHTLHLVD